MFNSEENLYASIAGWTSVACWIIVFTPQIWKNYALKDGEGLSMRFLVIWLIGDAFNIAGVVMEKLLPTMLFLAIYYTVADVILIIQVLYYRHRTRQDSLEEEFERLLHHNIQARSVETVGEDNPWLDVLPRGRVATDTERGMVRRDDESSASCTCEPWIFYAVVLAISLSAAVSIVGIRWLGVAQYFGWWSAILYIGSRVPQIAKNRRNESTEGLALGMFAFGILGNATYCLSIFLQSTDADYLRMNLPWLVGSGGTLFLDVFIGIQFFLYNQSHTTPPEPVEQQNEENTTRPVSGHPIEGRAPHIGKGKEAARSPKGKGKEVAKSLKGKEVETD